jgi:uncharacterized Zn finger protein
MMRATAPRELLEGRIRAAWINGGPSAATPRGNDRYVVTGRDGATRYTVNVLSSERAACDCPAGLHGRFCWHAAAAMLRRTADVAMGVAP